jgi:hypothetical protein
MIKVTNNFFLFCKEQNGYCINVHAYSLGHCATDGALDKMVCKFILDSARNEQG